MILMTEHHPGDRRMPPGPRGIAASVLNLARMQKNMLSFLRHLDRSYECEDLSPVRFVIAGQAMYLLRDPRHIHRLFKDSVAFPRTQAFTRQFRATLGYSLVTMSDQGDWKRTRRRTTQYFKSAALGQYGVGVN